MFFKIGLGEFLLIAGAIVVLLAGLTVLLRRRRDEILEEIFTPEESEIEQEFFKRIEMQQKKLEEPKEENTFEEVDTENFEWGDFPPGTSQ